MFSFHRFGLSFSAHHLLYFFSLFQNYPGIHRKSLIHVYAYTCFHTWLQYRFTFGGPCKTNAHTVAPVTRVYGMCLEGTVVANYFVSPACGWQLQLDSGACKEILPISCQLGAARVSTYSFNEQSLIASRWSLFYVWRKSSALNVLLNTGYVSWKYLNLRLNFIWIFQPSRISSYIYLYYR